MGISKLITPGSEGLREGTFHIPALKIGEKSSRISQLEIMRQFRFTLSLPSSKSTFSQPFKKKRIREGERSVV